MTHEQDCLQQITGNCRGCNILDIVATSVRWKRLPLQTAADKTAAVYCPTGVRPQTELIQNGQASCAMGQRREENLDFSGTPTNLNGKKLHGRY